MIREPYGVFPYNNTIDMSESQAFSFFFSGDRLASCAFQICNSNLLNTSVIFNSQIYEQMKIFSEDQVVCTIPALTQVKNENLMWRRRLIEYNANTVCGFGIVGSFEQDSKTVSWTNDIQQVEGDIYYLIINNNAYRLQSINFEQKTAVLELSNNDIKVNDSFTIIAEKKLESAKNVMGAGRIKSKPKNVEGKTFHPIDSTHIYIEPTTALRLGIALPSYEGITFYIGNNSSSIVSYDYNTSLITLSSAVNSKIGDEYFIKNAKDIVFVTGHTQEKPTDIESITYPAITNNSFYIGQHPKLKHIRFGDNKINERSVVAFEYKNKRYTVKEYDFDNGYITLQENLSREIGENYTIYANFLDTNYYYFQSREKPSLSISNFLFKTPMIIKDRFITFKGLYHRSSGESIKTHQWIIKQQGKEVIKTNEIFSSNLTYEFNEGLNNTEYEVTLIVTTQNNVVISVSYPFIIAYDEENIDLFPKTKLLTNRNGVEVSWSNVLYSNPILSNPPPEFSDNIFNTETALSGIILSKDSYIEYNEISESLLQINTNNFYFNTLFSVEDRTEGTFLLLKNVTNQNSFKVEKKLNKINFLLNDKVMHSVTLMDTAFGVTQTGVAKPDLFYIWQEDLQQMWNDDFYWTESISHVQEKQYRLILTSNKIQFYKYVDETPFLLMEQDINWNDAIYNSIRFMNTMRIESLSFCNSTINDQLQEQLIEFGALPTWRDFQGNGQIIVSFDNDIYYSSSGNYINERISSYLLYRCEVDNNNEIINEKQLGTIPAKSRNNITYFIDDSADNHKRFLYKIYPITSKSITGAIQTEIVEPDWEFWTFYEVKLNQEEKHYEVIGNPWNLKLNTQGSNLSVNTGRIIHNNLSKYPKATIGPQRFLTQSFSALLGNFNMSTETSLVNGDWLNGREYLDTYDRIQQWIDFTSTNNPILVQSPKGLKYLATISNLTFNIDEKTIEMLTTTNFDLTQIGDLDKYQVITL